MQPFKIIRKEDLTHTCIIELSKGKYRESHWEQSSLYIEEEDFAILEFFIVEIIPSYQNYGRYGVATIDKYQWENMHHLLTSFIKSLDDTDIIENFKQNKNIELFDKFKKMLKDDSSYKQGFICFINEVIDWVEDTISEHQCFTILGI